MLKSVRRAAAAGLAILLYACTPGADRGIPALSVEAGYRLMFNDMLVGHSLFVLQIDADGSYRLDAFTTPAGEMKKEDGDEVLESTRGTIDGDEVYPRQFENSVMTGGEIRFDRLVFDREKRLQHRSGSQGEHTGALLPGTQDRLSYILKAWLLARDGEGSAQVQIVSADASDTTRLRVVGKETLDVPYGSFETVAVRRLTTEPNVVRALWFDPGLGPLPLRVVHGWAGNTVDMQLESLRPPNHPR